MTFPKTAKGLSNRIKKIRTHMSAFKREYGFIDDGRGERYDLFHLYLLLGDNRRASEFLKWYEKEFPDDRGEPFQLLSWTLLLYRQNKEKADYLLAKTMLSNIYLIPFLLGDSIARVDMWHSSNYQVPEFLEYFPNQIMDVITVAEKEWIAGKYHSERYQGILKKYISIKHKLQTVPVGEDRIRLVDELHGLLNGFEVSS